MNHAEDAICCVLYSVATVVHAGTWATAQLATDLMAAYSNDVTRTELQRQ